MSIEEKIQLIEKGTLEVIDTEELKDILLLSPFLSHPGFSTGKIPPELSLIR